MLIYKATSKTSGKCYIGQTTTTLKERIDHHKRTYNIKNYHFYYAIRKYGWDDFEWEVIEDNINDANILNEREKYWIKYYDSYENGYNSTRGGDGTYRRDDELILKLFIEGKTTKEIIELTGYSRSTIYKSFNINNISEENNKRNNEQIKLRCSMPVLQYDLEGNFIKEWPSASACSQVGQQSAISNVCRQEQVTAYGYLWKYKNDDRPISEWVKRVNNKQPAGRPKRKIKQINDIGEIINIYESAAEAAKSLNLKDKSNICAAARNHKKAYGYYWEYLN